MQYRMQRTGVELALFPICVHIESQKADYEKNLELYDVKLINNTFEKVGTKAEEHG